MGLCHLCGVETAGKSASVTGNPHGHFQESLIAYMEIGQVILRRSTSQ